MHYKKLRQDHGPSRLKQAAGALSLGSKQYAQKRTEPVGSVLFHLDND